MYKIGDMVAVSKQTTHHGYPDNVAKIIEENNIFEVIDVSEEGLHVNIKGMAFFVFLDEVLGLANGPALFV